MNWPAVTAACQGGCRTRQATPATATTWATTAGPTPQHNRIANVKQTVGLITVHTPPTDGETNAYQADSTARRATSQNRGSDRATSRNWGN